MLCVDGKTPVQSSLIDLAGFKSSLREWLIEIDGFVDQIDGSRGGAIEVVVDQGAMLGLVPKDVALEYARGETGAAKIGFPQGQWLRFDEPVAPAWQTDSEGGDHQYEGDDDGDEDEGSDHPDDYPADVGAVDGLCVEREEGEFLFPIFEVRRGGIRRRANGASV